jgi:replication initiation protein RepC
VRPRVPGLSAYATKIGRSLVPALWGDACLAMGRELAAVALAVVSTKDEEHFRTSPGGYFHGMVDKAKTGELHLERTVWALRRASDPEHRERAGRGEGSPRREGRQTW